MKINKSTTIDLTTEDIEALIKKHINKEGYIVSNIEFNVREKVISRDPIDDRFDLIKLILDGCTVICKE